MMKILFVTFALFSMSVFSQENNAIFFSQNGEQFFVIVNGIKQNTEPATNVKVTGLNAPNYKVKIIFNNGLPEIDKNIYFNEMGSEITYLIKKDKKGTYKLRFFSQVPLAQAAPALPTQSIIVYHVDPLPATTTVTQTTVNTTQPATQGASVGVNVGGTGINMNVTINDGSASTTSSSVTYSETTTTTTTTTTSTPPPAPVEYVSGYHGPVGCPVPMSPQDFQSAKQTIASKSFEDSKLAIAKQIVNSNCLTSGQVMELVKLFDFEDTKLQFAKYCYGYTYDLGNYYKVNDAFEFESSIDELNNYISSH
jgi:hypothetical protein